MSKPSELVRRLVDGQAGDSLRRAPMAVNLYLGGNGTPEIVVQTNCTTVDGFVRELADAIESLASTSGLPGFTEPRHAIRSALANAMPIAFALAGYKAERVAESKLLTCGTVPTHGLVELTRSADIPPGD
jgi:hypothetical protein